MSDNYHQFFEEQMTKVRQKEFTNMLKCPLCNGLYRFAHTLVECGHTFCQLCISTYIKGFKGRKLDIRCPQCNTLVQQNYRRSIMKDVYKQNLVDTLAPQFYWHQKKILNRVQSLFPQFNLEFLLDNFQFAEQYRGNHYNSSEQIFSMAKLPERIKEKLGISFQMFLELIMDDRQYNRFLESLNQDRRNQAILDLRPRTERDFQYVGIKSKMKVTGLNPIKLKRFIAKKAITKITVTKDVPEEWITKEGDKLDIQINLYIDGSLIGDKDNLEDLVANHSGFISYSLP